MARQLSEFFSPVALSCVTFFKNHPKGPYVSKLGECDIQQVKKGGERVFAVYLEAFDCWIACNQTNARRLSAKFGLDVDTWVGRKVRISKQQTGFQGKDGFLLDPA